MANHIEESQRPGSAKTSDASAACLAEFASATAKGAIYPAQTAYADCLRRSATTQHILPGLDITDSSKPELKAGQAEPGRLEDSVSVGNVKSSEHVWDANAPVPANLKGTHTPGDVTLWMMTHPDKVNEGMSFLEGRHSDAKFEASAAWAYEKAQENGGRLPLEKVQELAKSSNPVDKAFAEYTLKKSDDGTGRTFYQCLTDSGRNNFAYHFKDEVYNANMAKPWLHWN